MNETAGGSVDAVVAVLLDQRVAPGVGLVVTIIAIAWRASRTKRWDPELVGALNVFIGASSGPVALGLMLASVGSRLPPPESIKLYLALAGLALSFLTFTSIKQFFLQPPSGGNEGERKQGS